jgi:GT2 family glycosyltransferase
LNPALRIVAVIVNYNAGDWLARAVRSVLASDAPVTVHVVDNASSDDSLVRLSALPGGNVRWFLHRNDANEGFARASNRGLRQERADYYVILNPDCEVAPEAIRRVVEAMERDPSVGLAGGEVRNMDGSVQETCRRDFPTPMDGVVHALALHRVPGLQGRLASFNRGGTAAGGGTEYVEAISGAFMVARGAALEAVGPLDEGYFMHCEDLDWCMRFQRAGWKVAFVPEAVVMHQKGVSSRAHPWRVNWYLHRGMLRFYDKYYRDRYSTPTLALVRAGVYGRMVLKAAVEQARLWLRRVP